MITLGIDTDSQLMGPLAQLAADQIVEPISYTPGIVRADSGDQSPSDHRFRNGSLAAFDYENCPGSAHR